MSSSEYDCYGDRIVEKERYYGYQVDDLKTLLEDTASLGKRQSEPVRACEAQ